MNSNRTGKWEPTRLSEFVGQPNLIKRLQVEIKAAKYHRKQMRHAVFSGPEGVGKSLLPRLLANEFNSPPPVEIMGKAVTHESLTQTLFSFTSGGYDRDGVLSHPEAQTQHFLVINECQRMSRELLNLMHPVLEPLPDGRRIFQAKQRGQTGPVWIVGFTCILISNYIGELSRVSAPTLSRFPLQHTFDLYSEDEIVNILQQYANRLNVAVTDSAVRFLARRVNGMARPATELFDRIVDFHLTEGHPGSIGEDLVKDFMDMEGIDANGLDRDMIKCLRALCTNPAGRLSQQSLESMLATDTATLTERIEPVLMRKGFVLKCSNGREITNAGRAALGAAGSNDDLFYSRRIA